MPAHDVETGKEFARPCEKLKLVLNLFHPCCPEALRMRGPSDLGSAFERMDQIHLEFERRKRLGLPYPSLDDLDRLFAFAPPVDSPETAT